MSTTKQFTNIKAGKRHQIDATARGYYDFRTTVVPQPNKPLSFDMRVYDGLNYAVDLSKNSVRPGEINFDGTVLPYIENNTLSKTNYCFGNSGTNYDLPVYNKEYVNINKIGDFDIGDGIVSNFYRDHYLTVTLPNYSSGSVNSFEILMKVHTPTNNTNNARILNSTDSYDNLAVDLGSNPGFNFCGDNIGFGSQFTADIDLWVKVQFDGTNLSLHHSLNGVDYIQDNSKSWSKSNVWFTSNTYSLGLRSYDFVNICFFNGTIDLNECYVKINDEIINFGENSLNLKCNDYSLVGNAKINNGICSGFDSSSRVLLNAINFTSEKDIIIGFTTSSDVTTAQKIFEYQNDGISFQIIDGMIQYWTKNNTLWNNYDVVEPNNSYKLKITITSNTSYTLGFMNVNDASYNNIEVTDTGLTIGKNLSFSIGNNLGSLTKPFLGTIDIKNIPGAIQTESKTGIFKDYEDNGKAKTLNAFSSNNELVVLSPNENIVDYTWLGTVNIPEHRISWNEPSVPDTPTIDPSTLKFGDRIDNKATVVGTFESSDLGTVAFAVLDAQYRNPSVEWVESNIVNSLTDMPLYTIDEALAAKESATHNTDYVISVGGEGAFSYCRSIDPLNYNGKTYNCQLPNAYELNEIYNNRESLDTFDTTVSANETKKLSNWGFGNPYQEVLSSSRDKQFGYGFHLNYRDGNQVFWRGNPGRLGVCPIIEIPLSK